MGENVLDRIRQKVEERFAAAQDRKIGKRADIAKTLAEGELRNAELARQQGVPNALELIREAQARLERAATLFEGGDINDIQTLLDLEDIARDRNTDFDSIKDLFDKGREQDPNFSPRRLAEHPRRRRRRNRRLCRN